MVATEPASQQSFSAGVSDEWNRDNFSRSSNGLLENLNANTSNSIVEVLNAYYNYFDDNLSNANINATPGNKHITAVLQLKNYLESKTNLTTRLMVHSSRDIAAIVTENVKPVKLSETEDKIVIRLFLAGIILGEFEYTFDLLENDNEFQTICIGILESLEKELPGEKPPVKLQDQLTDTGAANWKNIFEPGDQAAPETGNISDTPALDDLLSRRALAKYLSHRMDYVYKTQVKGRGAFFMHLDGAWGSGKSTLLNFIKEYLTDKKKKAGPPWIVIDFDAWANQRLDPPWWFIMKSFYKGTRRSFWKQKKYSAFFKFWFREHFWRLNTGTNYLIMAIVTAIISVFAMYSGISTAEGFGALNIIRIISFISFIWSSLKFFNTSLVPGSARAAKNFIEQNGNDPMAALASHFKNQVNFIRQPVTIFIDNLDRCNQEYGIKLLEGLQTIFRDSPIIYVVAADRKWLSTMFENQYSMFAAAMSKPAKSFGLIFLDKIFQLIVELPNISSIQKLDYWNYLLEGAKDRNGKSIDQVRESIRKEVAGLSSNKGKINMMRSSGKKGIENQILREEIVSALSIGEEEKILENKLSEFYDVVEPNPRAMKRIINDMSTNRAISLLYGQKVKDEVLVLYTILKLQYPCLSEFFWNNPEKLDDLHKSVAGVTGDKILDGLLADPEVNKLFCYTTKNKMEYKLDSDFIMKMKFEKSGF